MWNWRGSFLINLRILGSSSFSSHFRMHSHYVGISNSYWTFLCLNKLLCYWLSVFPDMLFGRYGTWILRGWRAFRPNNQSKMISGSKKIDFCGIWHTFHGFFCVFVQKGRLSEDEARFYTAEVVDALEYIHNMGLIHRDIKVARLSNIILFYVSKNDCANCYSWNGSRRICCWLQMGTLRLRILVV